MSNDNYTTCVGGPTSSGFTLMHPTQFMHILAEAIQDELAFFSHGMDGILSYLSKSAESVLQLSPNLAMNRPIHELLTDNPCNDELRSLALNPSQPTIATSGTCEFLGFGENAAPVKLKYWRTHVLNQGSPIGFSGILRRLDGSPIPSQIPDAGTAELISRVETLTAVEFQVIEMVVDGHMNKESAAQLNVAVRTIESRRSRAMAKLKTNGLSDLVQTWVLVRQLIASGNYERLAKLGNLPTKSTEKVEPQNQ